MHLFGHAFRLTAGLACLFWFFGSYRLAGEVATTFGQIYVSTDPPDATLLCDGVTCKQTPTTLMRVAPGEHLLIVRKAGYKEARKTITCQAGERIAVDLKLEPIQGLVLIHSRPEGADVEIADANYGKTPLSIHDFPLGKRRVRISARGYVPKVVEISVSDRTPIYVKVDLVSDSALLIIKSEPAGAQVTVDGATVGQTPCRVDRITSGKHKLEVNLKGYLSFREEIKVQAGDELRFDVKLKPLPGNLMITSIPEKARIYLNGRFWSETPFETNDVASGTYVIRAELRGYATQVRTNTIVAGEAASVEFRMIKNSGTIMLSTEPYGVNVFLDGEKRGITKKRGRSRVSEQLQIDLVPRGSHKLQLAKQGYYKSNKLVQSKPNSTLILHVKLRKRPVPFVPNVIVRTGPEAEDVFKGIIRERYENGDIKLEVDPGIFRRLRASEIVSINKIVTQP